MAYQWKWTRETLTVDIAQGAWTVGEVVQDLSLGGNEYLQRLAISMDGSAFYSQSSFTGRFCPSVALALTLYVSDRNGTLQVVWERFVPIVTEVWDDSLGSGGNANYTYRGHITPVAEDFEMRRSPVPGPGNVVQVRFSWQEYFLVGDNVNNINPGILGFGRLYALTTLH